MSALLETLNHLISAALEKQPGGSSMQVRSVRLDSDTMRVIARLDHPQFNGEVVLALVAEPLKDHRQTLRIQVESWPETLPSMLEPFRRTLEKARLHLELDFSP